MFDTLTILPLLSSSNDADNLPPLTSNSVTTTILGECSPCLYTRIGLCIDWANPFKSSVVKLCFLRCPYSTLGDIVISSALIPDALSMPSGFPKCSRPLCVLFLKASNSKLNLSPFLDNSSFSFFSEELSLISKSEFSVNSSSRFS